jgi:hypothetical protein
VNRNDLFFHGKGLSTRARGSGNPRHTVSENGKRPSLTFSP